MKERRKRNMSRTGLLFLFCLLMLCGCTHITEFMENTEVSGREVESLAAEKEEDTVLLGGMPVGIYMETDGVLVLDTEKMTGMDGKEYIPAQGVVSSGDYITEVNHQKIEGKKQLMDLVEHLDGEKVLLTVRRENTILEKKLTPVQISKGNYRLGIWVRDNVQGLGTITFLTKITDSQHWDMAFMMLIQVHFLRSKEERFIEPVFRKCKREAKGIREQWKGLLFIIGFISLE